MTVTKTKKYTMLIKINDAHPVFVTVQTRKKRTAIARGLLKIFKNSDPSVMLTNHFDITVDFVNGDKE